MSPNNEWLDWFPIKASELVLTSKDQTIMIQGYAGVGKTTQFKTVAQALNDNRPDVNIVGLAPTHKAVNELQAAGIKSQTIASFLMEKHQNNLKTSYKNTLFVIIEKGKAESARTIARQLLANGVDRAIVKMSTGLSDAEINALMGRVNAAKIKYPKK